MTFGLGIVIVILLSLIGISCNQIADAIRSGEHATHNDLQGIKNHLNEIHKRLHYIEVNTESR